MKPIHSKSTPVRLSPFSGRRGKSSLSSQRTGATNDSIYKDIYTFATHAYIAIMAMATAIVLLALNSKI